MPAALSREALPKWIRMKRLCFVFALLLCFQVCAVAQKKVIDQARTLLKTGKEGELTRAEKLMTDLLRDSANQGKVKIWLTLTEVVRKQYELGNEKLYLKQKIDTASLFTTAMKMFTRYETLDSVDALPDKKGRVVLHYRSKNQDFLHPFRPNLYKGGMFFTRKNDFAKAWDLFDAYVDCASQPLFSGMDYLNSDSLMPNAAFMSLYTGYRLKDKAKMTKYLPLALQDTVHLDNTYRYMAETYVAEGDTAQYLDVLQKGFDRYPNNPFFFPRLIDYLNSQGLADSANVVIDRACAVDSTNVIFLFAKSSSLLNAGRDEECIAVTQRLIALNDSMPEAYCNLGLAYYNQAVSIDRNMQRSRKKRRTMQDLYAKSLPYMEKFRAMAPDQQSKWVPALYNIYLNLNMGKEFEEIDMLYKKLSKP